MVDLEVDLAWADVDVEEGGVSLCRPKTLVDEVATAAEPAAPSLVLEPDGGGSEELALVDGIIRFSFFLCGCDLLLGSTADEARHAASEVVTAAVLDGAADGG